MILPTTQLSKKNQDGKDGEGTGHLTDIGRYNRVGAIWKDERCCKEPWMHIELLGQIYAVQPGAMAGHINTTINITAMNISALSTQRMRSFGA